MSVEDGDFYPTRYGPFERNGSFSISNPGIPCFLEAAFSKNVDPHIILHKVVDRQMVREAISLQGATYYIPRSMDHSLINKAFMVLPRETTAGGLTYVNVCITFETHDDKKHFETRIKQIDTEHPSMAQQKLISVCALKDIIGKVAKKKKKEKKKSTKNKLNERVSQVCDDIGVNKHIISQEHDCFELTFDMMLGIRTTVSRNLHPTGGSFELSAKDFAETTRLKFPSKGSNFTPAHKQADFYFKDYSPKVFRKIRELYGISNTDYLMDVCGNFQFLEFISNSKSGEFFFFTHDKQYMIKTISHDEAKILSQMMQEYYNHLITYPNTLLTRFFGLHKVALHTTQLMKKESKPYYFLIMGSVTHTKHDINCMYDLKGSKIGRSAKTTSDDIQADVVYKDNDFLHHGVELHFGDDREEFLEQIKADTKLLKKLKIMDYSLLLGVHDPSTPFKEDAPEESQAAKPSRLGDQDRRKSVTPQAAGFTPGAFPNMRSATTRDVNAAVRNSHKKRVGKFLHYRPKTQPGVVYFMGIIDVLITFGYKKQLESRFKSLTHDKMDLSAVDPITYADRFYKFIEKATRGLGDEERKQSESEEC